ncbi:pseudouridine synthase [Novipirellula artificiosorum]|uniref:Pseudouridine synthase n=1 Tax=Novipirellula artificiosorum TaxID=2528016 RepID=A0A5C6D3P0_9BACT|nr:pseudouridine synthase [Novipirellula artificiosorum]TWU31512.1 Ribosomal large subunit pseudouridine synthase B [Novipirellula artificiosorum]
MPRRSSKKKIASKPPAEPNKPIRLQRLLATAGFGSRRQCEELISEGRVEVNGSIVDKLGTTADPKTAKIYVDGTPLKPQRLVYYAVNKPTGVVTTNSDPEGRPRVIDLVPPTERVFPVGRLDRSSEGLILLTNDGDLGQQLAHPKYQIRKVYRVTVAGKITAEAMRSMEKGMYIAEGYVKVEGAKILKSRPRATELEITLREGKNREIRRVLARLGHKVQQLRRIAIGPLRLGEMPIGSYRVLTHQEIKKLHDAAEQSRQTADAKPTKAARPKRGPKKSLSRSQSGGRPKTKDSRSTSRGKPAAKGPAAKGPAAKSKVRINRSPDYEPKSTGGVVIGGEEPSAKTSPPAKSSERKRATKKRATMKRATKKPPTAKAGKATRSKAPRSTKKKRGR